jgi:glycosyltransferase involved in cell wall biosynthesis
VGAEGMKASHGENVLLADDEESFAESVIGAIQDRRMAQRLADNGRSTVEAHYDWKVVYRAWDQVYGR